MKFEYKIVYIDATHRTLSGLPEDINIKFDEYGRDGWELVKIEQRMKGGLFFLFFMGWINLTAGYVGFFKRPL